MDESIQPSAGAETQKRHVLLVTTGYPPEASGSGQRLHALYRRLTVSNPAWRSTVVTKRQQILDETSTDGPEAIHVFRPPHGKSPDARAAYPFREMWWALKLASGEIFKTADMVHLAGWSWYSLMLSVIARLHRIPIVRELTTFGDTGAVGGRGRYLIQLTNRLANSFVAISPALEMHLRSTGIKKKVWVRPNGIDTECYRPPTPPERVIARADLGKLFANFEDTDTVILHVGRIRPLKNQLFLAECVDLLPKEFKLLLVGPAFGEDDPYYIRLQQYIRDRGLSGRVAILEGMYEDIRQFYWGADIFAFPSTNEGLGNVMLEALCCGLPVSANRIEGVTDWIISPGANGSLGNLDVVDFTNRLQEAGNLAGRDTIWRDAHAQFDKTAIDAGYRRLLAETINSQR